VRAVKGDHFTLGEPAVVDLSRADVVLLRQDPPFDLAYITTTHLLERLQPKTLVSNDPAEVRNAPEKLLVTEFKELMPPTLIASDPAQIRAFREAHKDIVLKPLYGNGGAGAFACGRRRKSRARCSRCTRRFYREPIMVQLYLPEVRQGEQAHHPDRRRVRGHDQPHSGRRRGPLQHACRRQAGAGRALRPRSGDLRRHRPELKKRGLIFAGIDVIGDYLTEINVTSPTGIQEVKRFGGPDGASLIWDAIERRLKGRG